MSRNLSRMKARLEHPVFTMSCHLFSLSKTFSWFDNYFLLLFTEPEVLLASSSRLGNTENDYDGSCRIIAIMLGVGESLLGQ